MNKKTSIEINHISKTFQSHAVLTDVQIHIEEGEIFGLLGPSGAGKTTLIKILTGQLLQTSGEASILDTDTRRIPMDVYERLGMVLDNIGIYDRLSCYDNLSLFAEIYRVPKNRISSVLEKVGLSDAGRRMASNLSKGMRQRLTFARSILHGPDILFLDEPTSGLDPQTASQIHDLILKERDRGTTVFLTTHNMEEAAKLCSHIALLHNGGIVEYGSPKEICRRYNHQNAVHLLLKDGSKQSFDNNSSSAGQIYKYFMEDAVVEIHSSEPNLETVFMELTGRRFD